MEQDSAASTADVTDAQENSRLHRTAPIRASLYASGATRIRQTVRAANGGGDGSNRRGGRKRTPSVARAFGSLVKQGLVRITREHHQPPKIVFLAA